MRKLFFILFLFMATNVSSADFLETFSQYGEQIRLKLGFAVTESQLLPDTLTNQFVREAVITLMPEVRGDKLTTVTAMTFNQNMYSLDSALVGIRAVIIIAGDGTRPRQKSLRFLPQALWYEQDHQTTEGKQAGEVYPSFYDFTDDQIFMFPRPERNVTDTMYIYGFRKVPSIAAIDSLVVIPQKYRPAMVSYAAYLCGVSISSPKTGILKAEADARAQKLGVQLFIKEADVKTGN